MLKHKKFLLPLLAVPLFSVFSCTKVTETYQVIKYEEEGNLLNCVSLPNQWKNPIEAPFELSFDGLVVKFKETELTKQAKNIEEAKDELSYFICTSDSLPSKSIINNYQVAWSNTQVNTELNFYIAHLENNETIHLSNRVTVKVVNNGAFVGPWVIPVVSIGVALIVLLMVFFTRRYKAKKEGKI
ncbi:MAG: hypothetical protein MJ213_03255 [Bacilli bacterium]|nr:hypothetical protein [Bacilli bacterium]